MNKKHYITKICWGNYYLIYNFGNNNQKIFYNMENYKYFFMLYDRLLTPYFKTLAYCLIPNRFCFVIYVPYEVDTGCGCVDAGGSDDGTDGGSADADADSGADSDSDSDEVGAFFTKQLSRLLISYAQTIKKQENIKGSLFAKPYKRVLIDLRIMEFYIFYNHYLSERFKVTNDYRNYFYSSYQAIINGDQTIISKDALLFTYKNTNDFKCIEEFNYYNRKDYLNEFRKIDGLKEKYRNNIKRNIESLVFLSKNEKL